MTHRWYDGSSGQTPQSECEDKKGDEGFENRKANDEGEHDDGFTASLNLRDEDYDGRGSASKPSDVPADDSYPSLPHYPAVNDDDSDK